MFKEEVKNRGVIKQVSVRIWDIKFLTSLKVAKMLSHLKQT